MADDLSPIEALALHGKPMTPAEAHQQATQVGIDTERRRVEANKRDAEPRLSARELANKFLAAAIREEDVQTMRVVAALLAVLTMPTNWGRPGLIDEGWWRV